MSSFEQVSQAGGKAEEDGAVGAPHDAGEGFRPLEGRPSASEVGEEGGLGPALAGLDLLGEIGCRRDSSRAGPSKEFATDFDLETSFCDSSEQHPSSMDVPESYPTETEFTTVGTEADRVPSYKIFCCFWCPGTGSVHELLECPVCTNSMYPPIHQQNHKNHRKPFALSNLVSEWPHSLFELQTQSARPLPHLSPRAGEHQMPGSGEGCRVTGATMQTPQPGLLGDTIHITAKSKHEQVQTLQQLPGHRFSVVMGITSAFTSRPSSWDWLQFIWHS
ncbi:hypothetical protein MUK42_14521 [Musa troglodytarum]|uniref:Uncharacterized protein n=1 Tax=Musa troglodytarum TaxID=320322 RepID=A0A9E7KX01_9LILI|nr:hypothetical protein MUK42_14521 [Musa troglodytarum]